MALSEETMPKCSEDLSAYESAWEDHPELKSLYYSLEQPTITVINSLTAGAETGFFSQHAVRMEVSKNLFEVTQDLKNFTYQSDNLALKSMGRAYFKNILTIFEFFDNVMDRVEKAEMGQLFLLEAVAQFDKESGENDFGGKRKRYLNTLKELKYFKAMGDPFDGLVLTPHYEFHRVQDVQLLLLQDSLPIVSDLVHQLQKRILSLMQNVNEAIKDEEDMKTALNSIREKVTTLTETIKEVGDTVADRSKLILEARFNFLKQIDDLFNARLKAKINGSGK
ncbi:PREDICTED: UPF0496 protein At3g28270-like [Camelina sativa]|uniref:UPF0496 protein At3g28270-like n=1 Tax=Camelina sativa TaxID=90675 RepID=A0ABM0TFB8_CAMSA|nr:PREDICTED: UPF0496 protein At3g28270-like [Camelina sativa]